jgi:hypothetical protein
VPDLGKPDDVRTLGTAAPAGAPAAQDIWATSSMAIGKQTLDWNVQSGEWVAVVMNADGSPGVDARLRIGGEANDLGWIGAGVLGGGLLLIAAGGAGLWFAFRRS